MGIEESDIAGALIDKQSIRHYPNIQINSSSTIPCPIHSSVKIFHDIWNGSEQVLICMGDNT
jgi:hypothetical protein